jgi:hypothetical protein
METVKAMVLFGGAAKAEAAATSQIIKNANALGRVFIP